MKRLALYALCLIVPIGQSGAAVPEQPIVHVADGDCHGLQQALNLGAQVAHGIQTESAGQLVVLAKNGSYSNCFPYTGFVPVGSGFTLSGAITIEGSGATVFLGSYPNVGSLSNSSAIYNALVTAGAPVTFRNVNFVLNPGLGLRGGGFIHGVPGRDWYNSGDLILENSSILLGPDQAMGQPGEYPAEPFVNVGHIVMRNVTVSNAPVTSEFPNRQSPFIENYGGYDDGQILRGNVTVEQSTLLLQNQIAFDDGNVTTSNSVLTTGTVPLCDAYSGVIATSFGGNVLGDSTCGFNAAADHIVTDAGLGDFGNHGGVVNTMALNYGSPAIGAGLAANCAATDARGVARGSSSCDAGAYEFGGGNGQLGKSGVSGVYFDATHDGHYVTVQNLDNGGALVIWNTFNEAGKPAWLYGVGTVSGNTIHVANVSQNLGGVLQPGGIVLGSKETAWGSFNFTATNCLSATLKYQSANPQFGSGTVNLTRLAFVDGLDCSP